MNPDNRRTIETSTHHATSPDKKDRVSTTQNQATDAENERRKRDPLSAKPNIINLLYAVSFFTGFSGFVGLVLCYVWQNDPDTQPWEKSHFQYQIRTFWLGLLGMVIGAILLLVFIGLFVWLAVAVWTIVRCAMSFTQAQKGQAMPDPKTFLW